MLQVGQKITSFQADTFKQLLITFVRVFSCFFFLSFFLTSAEHHLVSKLENIFRQTLNLCFLSYISRDLFLG